MLESKASKLGTAASIGLVGAVGLANASLPGREPGAKIIDLAAQTDAVQILNTKTGHSIYTFPSLDFSTGRQKNEIVQKAESKNNLPLEQEKAAGKGLLSFMGITAFLGSILPGSRKKETESAAKHEDKKPDLSAFVSEDFLTRIKSEEPAKVSEQSEKKSEDKKLSTRLLEKVKGLWKSWEKIADLLPTPWSKITKYAAPVIAATCGVIWFQSFVQLGLAGMQLFGDLIAPIAVTTVLLIPMFKADKILSGIEKIFKIDPIKGWKRQAIIKPVQAALLIGAGIWTNALDLTPLTYGVFGAAMVGAGLLATKVLGKSKAAAWASVATALALPWSTALTTTRTFDVTVKAAGPDPEVAAWNVTTDLTVGSHWKKILNPFSKSAEPTGKSAMVLLNRDVPLFLPPHRSANSFNGDFQNLIGKKVRVTTVGTWLKPLSAKLQPTIVKYEVLE